MAFTSSESILHKLGANSFLSLWSYPNVYNDKGRKDGKGDGKEIADLLVVFGDHIIIFSDKLCQFPSSGDVMRDWARWKKRAIDHSIKQLRGAERWIKKFPDRIYLDKACTKKLYAPLPKAEDANFHGVIVANGAANACSQFHGQSGSLMISSKNAGFEYPFMVGQPEDGKGFVHVFNELTLSIIIQELDTISDFLSYLTKKEDLLDSGIHFSAIGEEELLGFYLKDVNEKGEHDFIIPKDCNMFSVDEGYWQDFENSKARKARIEADRISYTWDDIIEKFNYHAIADTLQFKPEDGLEGHEVVVRFMAAEPRTRRRMLCESLYEVLRRTPPHQRGTRILAEDTGNFPTYVFLLLPQDITKDYDEYRAKRIEFLQICCRCVPLVYPEATDIVGFATETHVEGREGRSEDAAYFDARGWSEKDQEIALEISKNLGLYTELRASKSSFKEYPIEAPSPDSKRTERNRRKRKRRKTKSR